MLEKYFKMASSTNKCAESWNWFWKLVPLPQHTITKWRFLKSGRLRWIFLMETPTLVILTNCRGKMIHKTHEMQELQSSENYLRCKPPSRPAWPLDFVHFRPFRVGNKHWLNKSLRCGVLNNIYFLNYTV